MSINTDYDPHLAQAKVTNLSTTAPAQFGISTVLNPNTTGNDTNIVTGAKDVVRWKGKSTTDIQPVRIYLGPWQPSSGMSAPPAGRFYMIPTPWMPPQPSQLDHFQEGSVYARIAFGGGGVQYQAFVDWPPRGCLLQVSAQYVQVDALSNIAVLDGDLSRMPRVAAHIAPEPGGGDSVQPATYTYPPRDTNPAPGTPGVTFQVPPFARAFRPLLDQAYARNNNLGYQVTLRRDYAGAGDAVWLIEPTAAAVPQNDFNRGEFPVAGNTKVVDVQAYDVTSGALRRTINVGMLFLLDL